MTNWIVGRKDLCCPMKDMQTHLEKLRKDAAECKLISDLATDPAKRALFEKLAEHLNILAGEVERAIRNQSGAA